MPTSAPPQALPASLCPICGQPNACAMETERVTGIQQPPCWCTEVSFSQALLDQIPAAARNTACVCAACVAANPA
ncbi:MAG: hypothetical protein BWK72_09955 [Rhodoferax ferrireducens]|uniref:DNA or RNA helicase of superfamily II n=2 Tax=Pseudomonadota TaxID=1224 RepID=A0A1Y1QYM0_9GAMM|nr:MAG: hypothetical protein BWK72_09955 [Rhodoferax ferrireducens]OQX16798.1 MAG: hypothetical protein BWK73_02330 [Thiothrix lacustris]